MKKTTHLKYDEVRAGCLLIPVLNDETSSFVITKIYRVTTQKLIRMFYTLARVLLGQTTESALAFFFLPSNLKVFFTISFDL